MFSPQTHPGLREQSHAPYEMDCMVKELNFELYTIAGYFKRLLTPLGGKCPSGPGSRAEGGIRADRRGLAGLPVAGVWHNNLYNLDRGGVESLRSGRPLCVSRLIHRVTL